MNTKEIINQKRQSNKYGCKAYKDNVSRIIATETGYKLDTIARVLNGINPASKPHHFMWLKRADEIMNRKPLILDGDGC